MIALLLSIFLLIPSAQAWEAPSVLSSALTEILQVRSDKPAYTVGESAILRATLSTKPESSDYEFDIVAQLNGVDLPITRTTDFELFSLVEDLQVGTYAWDVNVVIQDAHYARDLKEALAFYEVELADIADRLSTETDPDTIANLQAKQERYTSLHEAALSELSRIRTVVQTKQLSFNVL